MKNMQYISCLLAIFFISACSDKKLSEINDDPNRPGSVPTPNILLSAEKQLIDNIRNEQFSLRGTMLFAQYYSQNIYTDQSRYDIPRSYSDDFWASSYKALNNLNEIIKLNSDEETKSIASAGTAGSNADQIAISRILKAFIFHSLTDVFGNVPYESYGNKDPEFQALQQNPDNYTPAYASQEKIYVDLLAELQAAADTLLKNPTANTFGTADVIYQGDNHKWAKFANSLRLRLATRISVQNPLLSEEHFTDALEKGVFESNADNATFKYSSAAPNEAPLFRATVTANRRDFAVSHVLINALTGELGPFQVEDPRLSRYALPNAQGNYVGQPYGLPLEAGGLNGPTAISLPGSVVNAADFAEVLQEYAEVQFLISEYNNWDDASYRKGVEASLTRWGIPADEASAFAADLPAANEETVLTQKYLALFTQGLEAWSEIRRTGFPIFLIKPGEVVWRRQTENGIVNYTFQPLFGNGIPERLYYPNKEQNVNRENYQQALAAQGDDVITTALWWNK
ncbi:SusD/RagB family nutrient-binding outer membrane lipoprotein [Olivibacter sp. SDN3]|uniref:SusD/RagB family nutrient-binding outer membrane lipoprotein n=1 Tax=Olivibacter sp. SDN3 TaxID=2764720 RepID=UPI0016518C9D|nr:SusD/RagB family nutrient-binding outer membrane lipoprotein [Olivibacter sp. SDN3]QNL48634.1 SusD/RagB family nutrient-binding outer membrane lipoprotein [Olivibacter sp. SDN3]